MVLPFARLNAVFASLSSRLSLDDGVSVEVLQPEEVVDVRPVAMLAGQAERATGTNRHSKLQDHLDAVVARQLHHAPVLRKRARNVLIGPHGMASAHMKIQYDRRLWLGALAGHVAHVPKVRYCQDYVSWRYFGHWLTDAMPSSLIDGAESGELWMPYRPEWHHCEEYRKIFGLSLLEPRYIWAEEVVFYQDFGQGSHKRQRYAQLREALHTRFGGRSKAELVYLRRGNTGAARTVRDEDRLVETITGKGWLVLDIASASVGQLQEALCGARIVVSVEGSHLDHAHLSLRTGGAMIVLNPHDSFNSRNMMICPTNGIRAGCVVLNGAEGGGYELDWDEVERTIDLIERDAIALPH